MSQFELIERLIEANGGQKYWESIQSIAVDFYFSGPALEGRGFPGIHEVSLTIDTKQSKVVFHKFGNIRGVYTPSRTEVGPLDSQEPLSIRDNPRDGFRGYSQTTPWDEHNLIYFVGYAFQYYLAMPFCFRMPGFKTRELETHERPNGERWRVLNVEFPDDFITHSKSQNLFFDQGYRLRRMEYNVEIINSPSAAHLCFDHKSFGKLIVPTFRYVGMRDAGVSHMCAFVIQMKDVQVKLKGEIGGGSTL
ncbi:hypothetical protein PV08_06151 [Exophiala spinifera]|uniref:Uncharacterized protein n=1 Tax=Exophiala spinifera TaxID=91928 RepID=A0A0D2BBW2_9EURO|nr:uncharacterized protein PV08_06151 [Exophiala spinifera]KIW16100.1 hypothetical protein PV08_06151 [Exophiala spinifera]